jgi:hypothetical protein
VASLDRLFNCNLRDLRGYDGRAGGHIALAVLEEVLELLEEPAVEVLEVLEDTLRGVKVAVVALLLMMLAGKVVRSVALMPASMSSKSSSA